MNAVYAFPARLEMAKRIGREKLAGGELDNKQFNDFVTSGPLLDYFSKPDATVRTLHVLKDGADSVGLLGALNRVYMNIGVFSEEWLLHFNAVVGGKDISPIKIADAQKNSGYWQATELGTPNTALFFLKAAQPDHLKDAPGGAQYLTDDAATLERGKIVFADTCARCHSSKAPPPPAPYPAWCAGAGYLDCFKAYWKTNPDEGVQGADEEGRPRARLPRRQLPLDRRPHPGDAPAHQRLQPACDQRDRRQHLGQLLLALVQGAALGRHDNPVRPVHRRARCRTRCPPAAAATRACRR